MASIVPVIALGRSKAFADAVGTGNAALIVIPVETSGLEADSVLRDKADVTAFFAGSTNEQTTMGRKTITSVTGTVDTTNDRYSVDCADITWTAASGNAISKLLFAFDNDTTTGTDTNLVPWVLVDFAATPDGSDLTATITDFIRITSAA
jgi:hypothetical protein